MPSGLGVKRFRYMVAIFFVGWLSLLASTSAKTDDNTIILGAPLSITGQHSKNGKHTRSGYQIAIEAVNESGGVKVDGISYNLKLKYYDDESTPEIAAKAVKRLVKWDKALLLLGPYGSATTGAVAKVAEKMRVPFVQANGAASSLFTKGYKYQFAVLSTADKYLAPAVDMLAEATERTGGDLKKLKVGIAIEPDAFSRDLRDGVIKRAKELGMGIIFDEFLPRDFKDMTFILEKVKAERPDLLVVSGHESGAKLAMSQITKQKIDVPMLAMTHCEAADLHGIFGTSADYTICSTQWSGELPFEGATFGRSHQYKRAYEARHGYFPTYQSAESSAAVLVVADAIKRAGSLDREKIREALTRTDLDTFYGHIKFDAQGRNVAKPMLLRQLYQGRYLLVSPTDLSSHKLIFPRPLWSKR